MLKLEWRKLLFTGSASILPDKILFGIINGIVDFQRLRDKLIDYEELKNTFHYLDNITVADNAEHDKHAKFFKDAATAS